MGIPITNDQQPSSSSNMQCDITFTQTTIVNPDIKQEDNNLKGEPLQDCEFDKNPFISGDTESSSVHNRSSLAAESSNSSNKR